MSKLSAISKYCRNIAIRQRVTKRICSDGSVLVFYNGATMSEQAFNELFPVGMINMKRENVDPRRNWMN